MQELRNRLMKKSDFFLSFFVLIQLLTSIAYKLKQFLSYFMHRITSLSS